MTLPEAPALTAHSAIRAELPPGYIAHLGTNRFLVDEQLPAGDVELVIARGADQFDILRTARTDAVNFGILTEAIIKQLESWDRAHGIDNVLANTVVFKLRERPVDLDAFAKEVYAFCPDVVDQGTGTLAALAKEIGARGEVSLWWD